MARQIRFAFADGAGAGHSLALLPAPKGKPGVGVLDGKLVALRAEGRRREFRRMDLGFSVRSGMFGTRWTLSCDGRQFPEQPSSARLSAAVLTAMVPGPANALVDEAETAIAIRRVTARGPEARDAWEFHEMLEEFTPRRWVTPVLVGLNVLVYVLMLASKGEGPEEVLRWGALYAPRVKDGQVWRLFTCMFVHFGFLHLFFNMLLLVGSAPIVERIVGNVGFAFLYLVSGLMGGIASLYFNPGLVGGGASGAVFGVLGGILGLMTRYHVYIHLKDILKVAVLVVLLLVDHLIENRNRPPLSGRIDVAAHVGGFLGGLVCGAVLCQRVGPSVPAGRLARNSIVAVGGLLLTAAGVVLSPRVDDVLGEIRQFIGSDQKVEVDVLPIVTGLGTRLGNPAEMESTLEGRIIPEYARTSERLAAMSQVPAIYRDLVGALREYARLRGESWSLLLEAVRWNDVRRLPKFRDKSREAETVLMRFLLTQMEERPPARP